MSRPNPSRPAPARRVQRWSPHAVRLLMRARRVRIAQLAARLGVPPRTVSSWLTPNGARPSDEQRRVVAAALRAPRACVASVMAARSRLSREARRDRDARWKMRRATR